MKYTFLLLFLLFAMSAGAQSAEVIEIDSNTFEPMKPLPFDKRFVLRIPIKTAESVSFIGIIKHDRQQGLDTTIRRRIIENRGRYQIPEISENYYKIQKGDKKNFLQIDFRDTLLLDPSRKYTILFSSAISSELIDVFEKYHAINSNTTTSDVTKAQNIKTLLKDDWNKIAEKIREKTGVSFGIRGVSEVDKLPDNLATVNDSTEAELKDNYTKTKALFDSRDTEVNRLQPLIDASAAHTNFTGNATLSAYFRIISKDDVIFEKEFKKALMSLKEQSQVIYNLIVADQAIFKEFIGGLKSINCPECEASKTTQIGSRIANIKKSISLLKEIESTAFTIGQSNSSFIAVTTNVRKLIIELQGMLKILDGISVLNAKIASKLNEDRNLHTTEIINGNSFVIGFETRNKFAITPDFGLLTNWAPPQEFKKYPMLIPYLGFQINFRFIDKDQDFWSYRKRPAHFFSAFVGWSLNSIEDKDRGISNFFGSSSLITGLGFRLGNALRLTYSRLWYYKTPTGSTTPNLRTLGLIGLSLDMGLKDIMNGLSIFFPPAK